MRNIMFTALLMGCFIASALAQHDSFQFTDSQGRCWSCSPGQPCLPCSNNNIRPRFDNTCPAPDCSILENRATLYAIAGDPKGYNQCVLQGATWTPMRVDCQCSTYFDFGQQNCQSIWDWNPYCLITGPLPDPVPCEDPTTIIPTTIIPTTEPATTEVITTPAPTTVPQQPCVPCPCMPCMIWWMCQPCNQPCNNGCFMG